MTDLNITLQFLRAAQGATGRERAEAIRAALPLAAQRDGAGAVVRDYLRDGLGVALGAEEAAELRQICTQAPGALACAWRAAHLRALEGVEARAWAARRDALGSVWVEAAPLGSLEARREEARWVSTGADVVAYRLESGAGADRSAPWHQAYLTWCCARPGQRVHLSVARLAVHEVGVEVSLGRAVDASLCALSRGEGSGHDVAHARLALAATQPAEIYAHGWLSAHLRAGGGDAGRYLARLLRGEVEPTQGLSPGLRAAGWMT
jgi:hypothetical protein